MSFQLLKEDTVYKQTISTTGGSWVSGVWYAGGETINHVGFDAIWEPFNSGQESLNLPQGVSNEDAVTIFTAETLVTNQSLDNDSALGDIVYLDDPNLSTSHAYQIWEKEDWRQNQGFTLVSAYYTYLAVRLNRT
jgi:hypothetical protein